MSGGGEGVGVGGGPSCSSHRFLDSGMKPDGEGIETSSSGEFGPVVEATGESREKEFWVAIPGEATGVEKETFLCFLGIFKHQKKGLKEDELHVCVCVCVCVLFSAVWSGHVAGDRASQGAYRRPKLETRYRSKNLIGENLLLDLAR